MTSTISTEGNEDDTTEGKEDKYDIINEIKEDDSHLVLSLSGCVCKEGRLSD